LLAWLLILSALVLGILAGHFGWGKRWTKGVGSRSDGSRSFGKLHPDYLTGLDYLVTEQPDRALDMFLKLLDASADTIETHFALGALYRRRGEVERAIRIHQNLLARDELAPEHREQALLALAQDYLRAGLLDRAEGTLSNKVSRGAAAARERARGAARRVRTAARVAASARRLSSAGAHQGRAAAAGGSRTICASSPRSRSSAATSTPPALSCVKRAAESAPFPRAALLRAQIAERAE
jgi:lipopolysaccharide biosynthesis regulator YciM